MAENLINTVRALFSNKRKDEPELLREKFDPRVIKLDYPAGEYATLDEKTKSEVWNGKFSDMVSAQIMEDERFSILLSDIRTRFAGKTVGLRGILTSLDGDLSVKNGDVTITVFDINKLLQDGTEQVGAKKINIAWMGLAESVDEVPHRVEQYFLMSVKHTLAREKENENLRDKLFPAIVVYDVGDDSPLGKLNTKPNGYLHVLPEGVDDRKNMILGVYPIDVRFSLPIIGQTQI